MNNAKKGGHHIWLSGPELHGLNNYQAKGLLLSALAHLLDDGSAQLPDVEKALYVATYEA
jgi:hypothetical protein